MQNQIPCQIWLYLNGPSLGSALDALTGLTGNSIRNSLVPQKILEPLIESYRWGNDNIMWGFTTIKIFHLNRLKLWFILTNEAVGIVLFGQTVPSSGTRRTRRTLQSEADRESACAAGVEPQAELEHLTRCIISKSHAFSKEVSSLCCEIISFSSVLSRLAHTRSIPCRRMLIEWGGEKIGSHLQTDRLFSLEVWNMSENSRLLFFFFFFKHHLLHSLATLGAINKPEIFTEINPL